MSLLDVVFRSLNKDGDGFIEPRREDGHGASQAAPTFVRDSYAQGELLDDQTASTAQVLTFTFSEPVVSFWVAVSGVDSLTGFAKVDHYGGTPSATRGIPVAANSSLPIPEPATVVRVFAQSGATVTVWGQRYA